MSKSNPLSLKQLPRGASLVSVTSTRLSRLLRTRLGELLQDHGNIGLPSWRIYVGLAVMGEGTQKELVNFTRIEQSHISRALAQLEDKGEIVSRRCDFDKRARRFSFTPAGLAKYERLLPIVETYSKSIDQTLSAEEMELYVNLTQRIAQVVETSAEAANKRAKVALT